MTQWLNSPDFWAFAWQIRNVDYSIAPLRLFKNIEIKEMTMPINAMVLAAKNSDSVAASVSGSG